jgi:hypothetical protein
MSATPTSSDGSHSDGQPNTTPDDPSERYPQFSPRDGEWVSRVTSWAAGVLGILGLVVVITGLVVADIASQSLDLNIQAPGPVAIALAWTALLIGFLAASFGLRTLQRARTSTDQKTWSRPLALTGCIAGPIAFAIAAGGLLLLATFGSANLTG